MQYLFAHPGFSIRADLYFLPTTRDLTMVNTFGALWANFIKYGYANIFSPMIWFVEQNHRLNELEDTKQITEFHNKLLLLI